MEFYDEYDIIYDDPKVIYTPENIPITSTEAQFEDIAVGCQCVDACTIQNDCSCLHGSPNYDCPFTTKNSLNSIKESYKVLKRDMPIYECNQNCKCTVSCENRLTQYGPRRNLRIVPSKIDGNDKGAGVFTNALIQKGNFICEYAGEMISKDEANIRFRNQEKNNMTNYIFCVSETFGTNTIRTIVDPCNFGNIGRYINHSCNPNSQVIPVRVNCIIPKLCIFAIRDINENEEVTFDYGDGDLGFSPIDDSIQKKKYCFCDQANCRKYLPFCKDLCINKSDI